MHFKTSAEIKAQKEAAGKSSQYEEKRKAKQSEKEQRKYARMAEESAKREAEAKKKAEAKPKLVVDRSKVIVAPVLAERQKSKQSNFGTAQVEDAVAKRNIREKKASAKVIQQVIEAESQFYGGRPVPKAEPKQVWDDATKQWVKKV